MNNLKMKNQWFSFLVLIIVFANSCTSPKKLIYFQGSIPNSEANKNYNPLLKPDDLL